MTNIGTLSASIGLDVDALERDRRQAEQIYKSTAASAKSMLTEIGNAEAQAKRQTAAYSKEINALAMQVERQRAQLKVLHSDAGQALSKESAALQRDIDKVNGKFNEQKEQGKGLERTMVGLGRSLVAVAAAYISIQGAQRLIRFIVGEGMQAEKVWNDVAASLKLHGFEVDDNLAKMKAFANARLQATGIGDETTAQAQIRLLDANINLADSYRLVAAAQDLSVAKDMDLVSAADIIGKSIDSDINALGRYGIQIDKTLPKQQQINQLLAELGSRFGGRAAAAMEKTAGKMALLSATTGNLAENLFDKLSPGLNHSIDDLLSFVDGLERATKSASDLASLTHSELSGFDKQSAALKPLIDRYDQLQAKASLNGAEQEELARIIREVSAVIPTAVNAWDNLGEAVGINTEFLRKYNSEQRALLRHREGDALSTLGDQWKEVQAQIAKAKEKLLDLQNTKFPDPEKLGFGKSITLGSIEFNTERITGVEKQLSALQDESVTLERTLRDLFDLSDPEGYSDAVRRVGQAAVDAAEQNIPMIERLRRAYGEAFANFAANLQSALSAKSLAVTPALDDDAITRTLQAYDSLVSSGKATAGQLNAIWGDYTGLRLKQLEKELAGLENIPQAQKDIIVQAEKTRLNDALIGALQVAPNRVIGLYQPILASQKLTVTELGALWGGYSKAQQNRIEQEVARYGELGSVATSAYRRAAQAAISAEKIGIQQSVIQRQIDEQKKLMESGILSAQTLDKSWDEYTKHRVENLALEIQIMTDVRNAVVVTIEDINKLVNDFNQADNRLQIDLDTRKLRTEFDQLQSILSSSALSKQQFDDLRPQIEQIIPETARVSVELDVKFKDASPAIKALESQLRAAGMFDNLKAATKSFRDEQIAALEVLLQSNTLTTSELDSVWGEYYALQQSNLADLRAGWKLAGLTQERVGELTDDFNAKLKQQEKDIDRWGKSWERWFNELDKEAQSLATGMSAAFEDVFFRAMEGEFVHFRDFVKAIVADITQYMMQEFAKLAAQSLTRGLIDLFSSGVSAAASSSGGSSAGPIDVPAYAAGGLVTSPTFAMVGEAGPEVVVPVGRMNDPSFWEGIGMGGRGRGGDSITVQMTVVTPDIASFKANSSQIMAEAQVRAGQAFRRNR